MPLAGIEIGDCGEKIGLNGVDNGWCRFHNFRVPKDSLLDKYGQIDDEGNYITKFELEGKRFGMQMASLSGGRVFIGAVSPMNTLHCLTIAM